jgi:hypothetical protein
LEDDEFENSDQADEMEKKAVSSTAPFSDESTSDSFIAKEVFIFKLFRLIRMLLSLKRK